MVLKIKEREEAIQLLAMDPQVCGKLLTHHRKGSKVDVEALRDRFPLRQSTGKGLQMGSRKNRGLRRRKGFLFWLSGGFPIFVNLQKWNQVKRSHVGPTRQHGVPPSLGSALLPCEASVRLLASSRSFQGLFCPEKNLQKVSWHLDFIWYCFSKKPKTSRKQQLALGTRLIGQSQKMIYKCI